MWVYWGEFVIFLCMYIIVCQGVSLVLKCLGSLIQGIVNASVSISLIHSKIQMGRQPTFMIGFRDARVIDNIFSPSMSLKVEISY